MFKVVLVWPYYGCGRSCNWTKLPTTAVVGTRYQYRYLGLYGTRRPTRTILKKYRTMYRTVRVYSNGVQVGLENPSIKLNLDL